jgi:arylsulfatase A-like enzyme
MRQQLRHTCKQLLDLLPYLFLATIIFLFWQISLLCSYKDSYGTYVASVLLAKNIHNLPWQSWRAISYYGLTVLGVNLLWALAVWVITVITSARFRLSKHKAFLFCCWTWVLSAINILFANQIFFPNSFFATFNAKLIPLALTKIMFYFITTALLVLSILALLYILRIALLYYKKHFIIVGAIATLSIGWSMHNPSNLQTIFHARTQPNIIIIGIDALSPTHIHYLGYNKPQTPYLDKFLQKSTIFNASITPMAHTFAAWGSILTGQYPVNNKLRENYQDTSNLTFPQDLPTLLKHHGYRTLFATDDISFSNIDKNFGFDQLVTSSEKASTLIIAGINDFPLINLLINTWIGKILFPDIYANRLAAITYNPDKFNGLVQKQLATQPDQPLFLAIHLCLTHWPFIWAEHKSEPNTETLQLYDDAIQRADQQFHDLIQMLNAMKLLDNAVIIVLSDHGESLYLPDERMIKDGKYLPGKNSRTDLLTILNYGAAEKNKILPVSGHGTDILSFVQYNNLLAVQTIGFTHTTTQQVKTLVSLIDIKPTILELLNLPASTTDGQSLLPYLQGKKDTDTARLLFAETGFTPMTLLAKKMNVAIAITSIANMFNINPITSIITVKPESLKKIIKQKQRAVYYRNWVLALLPTNTQNLPILINRNTQEWTDDLSTDFAQKSPANMLLLAMQKMYAKEMEK